ncbi:OLC1v1029593C1 [Oldenlandia corymbosa var. corymbosa]|uniref:OLC1v1029593C1 n=1 Tax=Oldenlandia corymbosa var. corymbosa TaxID=529605 RepID=A0AAV1CH96_OLDCO|nr:OLC1v1029593C1 [Oldenlandia corymbosa var. corymbosa]
MEVYSLLERYRLDRRKLLEFVLSLGLIKDIRTPSGTVSDINFDYISVDYVLHCIQSGGALDVGLATRKYHEEFELPITTDLQSGECYFLRSDPESAGSPPRRPPPSVVRYSYAENQSSLSNMGKVSTYKDVAPSGFEDVKVSTYKDVTASGFEDVPEMNDTATSIESVNIGELPDLGLPSLQTGLLGDDLRETAYEACLACMLFSGMDVSIQNRKKEKNPRFLSGMKSKRGKHFEAESPDKHLEFLDTIRMQMQISEAMDALARRHLGQFASVKAIGQITVPEISLGLLNSTFVSDFPNVKSYMNWKNRHVNTVEEYFSSATNIADKTKIALLIAKVKNSEEWDKKMSYSERNEILSSLRQYMSMLSSKPGRFGLRGETYFWASGYHVNIRLYIKLLFGLFDILEDSQLIQELDQLLKVLQLTWPLLGITNKLHNALYAWVLFRQFVRTEEGMLLDYAIRVMEKFRLSAATDRREDEYLSSLVCSTSDSCEDKVTLIQSIISSISSWCDIKLQDYHLHFSQKSSLFKGVVTVAVTTWKMNGCNNFKMTEAEEALKITSKKVRKYADRSLQAACKRVTGKLRSGCEVSRSHILAALASELRVIAEREISIYYPVLHHWYPEMGMVAAVKLHRFYGERLIPYLQGISCLSEDVKEVLPAANSLENCLTELYSACQKNGSTLPFSEQFVHYKVGEVSRPLVLDWIIAQHSRIMEWTGRAFDLENWEPLSHQQKHAASAVEVFRIMEETVDQLFELKLPLDVTHLQALLSIVFHTLDAYLQKVTSQLVDKNNLYPPVPPLTHYKETTFPIAKKKVVESAVLDEEVNSKLNDLTTSKLCVRLNTLQYLQKQISALEDGIRKSWASAGIFENTDSSRQGSPGASGRILDACGESVDELFAATFDCIRDTTAHSIRQICEFIGARVVFWDLRKSFLYRLYHGGVEHSRLDSIIQHLDTALNHVCGLIDNALRDRVVSSIFKSTLEGYVWVLLDGGPSCAFSDSDVPMLEEDLNMLKDLFIADGEGLPRSLVEEEAKFAHQILGLFALQAESVIQLLMSSSEHISVGMDERKYGNRCLGDADTLIRVLCHKKDREASKFLKERYRLPASSGYDEEGSESNTRPTLMTEFIMRSASARWGDKGSSSFRSFTKKLQEATWK